MQNNPVLLVHVIPVHRRTLGIPMGVCLWQQQHGPCGILWLLIAERLSRPSGSQVLDFLQYQIRSGRHHIRHFR